MVNKSFFRSVFTKPLLQRCMACNLFLLTVTSCACTESSPESRKEKKDKEIAALDSYYASRKIGVAEAIAHIKSFKDDHIQGKVTFTRVPDGIKIVADIDGLSPGKHGFHIHEFGNCSNDGEAAGGHFNPTDSKHGGPDSPERHVGDLGNLLADEKGHAHYERVDKIISFAGENSIIGRSIIIHENPDDYTTQPTGDSGKKIACGVIEVVESRKFEQSALR